MWTKTSTFLFYLFSLEHRSALSLLDACACGLYSFLSVVWYSLLYRVFEYIFTCDLGAFRVCLFCSYVYLRRRFVHCLTFEAVFA